MCVCVWSRRHQSARSHLFCRPRAHTHAHKQHGQMVLVDCVWAAGTCCALCSFMEIKLKSYIYCCRKQTACTHAHTICAASRLCMLDVLLLLLRRSRRNFGYKLRACMPGRLCVCVWPEKFAPVRSSTHQNMCNVQT